MLFQGIVSFITTNNAGEETAHPLIKVESVVSVLAGTVYENVEVCRYIALQITSATNSPYPNTKNGSAARYITGFLPSARYGVKTPHNKTVAKETGITTVRWQCFFWNTPKERLDELRRIAAEECQICNIDDDVEGLLRTILLQYDEVPRNYSREFLTALARGI
jgi:hypothetical protein